MSPAKKPQQRPKHQRHWWNPKSVLQWLLQPSDTLPEPYQRRSRLLMVFLLVLFLLTFSVLIVTLIANPPDSQRWGFYLKLIAGILALLILSYGLNKAGYYQMSAGLLVAIALLGPWISIILDPETLQEDFVPLVYIVIPILLSSLLLPITVTLVVVAVQLITFVGVYLSFASMFSFNWISFISFVAMVSLISIISSMIAQKDLKQIEDQKNQLELNQIQLRELSIRDHLTGLYNRRYLDEILAKEIQRAARKGQTIGIIMLDIDHYKEINDKFGHDAGDKLLLAIAEIQKNVIRTYDSACRYGGDEFVLILPDTSIEATIERAELLRARTRQLEVESGGQILDTITLSAGVAAYPDDGLTVDELLKAADEALYRAKQAGRNQVAVAE